MRKSNAVNFLLTASGRNETPINLSELQSYPELMTSDAPTIRDLQDRAQHAIHYVNSTQRNHKSRLSRSARLHLIDVLSRWGGSGIALIGGLAIFIAVFAGRIYPMRSALWILMMMAALYTCRSLRRDFRAGEKISAHPFRWRAQYTAALSVVSATFGAGAFITAPTGLGSGMTLQTCALILAGAIGAAALHIAHGRTVASILVPAALFVIGAVWKTASMELAIFGAGAVTIAASAGLFLASRQLQQSTAIRFPRTTLLRRDTLKSAETRTIADTPKRTANVG